MTAKLFCALLFLFVSAPAFAQEAPPEYGPAKGTLLIVGGGTLDGSGIFEKFIELGGGKDKKLQTSNARPLLHSRRRSFDRRCGG